MRTVSKLIDLQLHGSLSPHFATNMMNSRNQFLCGISISTIQSHLIDVFASAILFYYPLKQKYKVQCTSQLAFSTGFCEPLSLRRLWGHISEKINPLLFAGWSLRQTKIRQKHSGVSVCSAQNKGQFWTQHPWKP